MKMKYLATLKLGLESRVRFRFTCYIKLGIGFASRI